jgi:hypothetical protein
MLPNDIRRWRLAALTLALTAMVVLAAWESSGRSEAGPHQAGQTVHYGAGWNLVAAPTGSLLDKAVPPEYAYGPTSSNYFQVQPGAIVGGRAVWAYFPTDTDVALGPTAATETRVQAPADHWVLLGNPSTTDTATIYGADAVDAYSATQGYFPVTSVAPGQGVWVLRHIAGEISLRTGADSSDAEQVRSLESAFTQDPTSQLNFDQAGALGSELVASRRYGDVQQASDDLLSAIEDGLQERGGSALPPPSALQRADAVTVRESINRAMFAAASGDTASADTLVEQAKNAAQSSEDDGVSLTRGQGTGLIGGYAALRSDATPTTLIAYVALMRAGFPAIALGLKPGTDFWNVAFAVLNGQPIPPPPQSSPPTQTVPTVVTTSPSPSPSPAPKTLLLLPSAGMPGDAITFVAGGFTPGQVGVLTFSGQALGTVPVGSGSTASGVFAVPNVNPGTYVVTFLTPSDGPSSTPLTVLPKALPSPTPSPVPTPTCPPTRATSFCY